MTADIVLPDTVAVTDVISSPLTKVAYNGLGVELAVVVKDIWLVR